MMEPRGFKKQMTIQSSPTLFLGLILSGFAFYPAFAGQGPSKDTPDSNGPWVVGTDLLSWHDNARNRPIPVKIYFPKELQKAEPSPRTMPDGESSRFPVILFSHGLGGSRGGYRYLGEHWASQGYICLHLQHLGSDEAVWKDVPLLQRIMAMRKAATDPLVALDRPKDVRFVLDRLEILQKESGLWQGKMDLKKVGLAGHSFGAWTTMICAGQKIISPGRGALAMAEPRIRAAISMSYPVLKENQRSDTACSEIKIPLFHMTGTLDDSPIAETKAEDRRKAFDAIRGIEQYLISFEGGDHMVFAGKEAGNGAGAGLLRRGDPGQDRPIQDLIQRSSTAFWEAYLKGSREAKASLIRGDLAEALRKKGQFETKDLSP